MHVHLRVFFYQQEQLETAVCEENAVCTELMALPRDNYFSLKSCSCPNGYTCPERPGTSTLPFGRGRWWETKLILIFREFLSKDLNWSSQLSFLCVTFCSIIIAILEIVITFEVVNVFCQKYMNQLTIPR